MDANVSLEYILRLDIDAIGAGIDQVKRGTAALEVTLAENHKLIDILQLIKNAKLIAREIKTHMEMKNLGVIS